MDHVPFGRDLAGHLERLVVEAQRLVWMPHFVVQIAAAHQAEHLLSRDAETRGDLACGVQVRLRGSEVVPARGDGREPDPHARDPRFPSNLHVVRERALEVLAGFVPGSGFQMHDAEVGAGDGDVGEVAEAGGDFHRAEHVPRGLPPIGEVAVQDAEVVVGPDDAVVVV